MIAMDDQLSQEQMFMLRRVALEAKSMSREELIAALCASWEVRFQQKQYFTLVTRANGMVMRVEEKYPWPQPETEEEFATAMGFVPTEEEAMQYLKQMHETATMELDMDEIVLTPDDESGV
jgi:lysozyme family protein